MGLLDMMNTDSGLLGAHLLAAAAPRAQRTSLGEGLLSAVQGVKSMRAQEEERKLRAQMMAAQMAELTAQADQRQAALEAAKAQAQRGQQFRGALAEQMAPVSPVQALAAGGAGPSPAAAALIGQQRTPNWQALAAQFPEQSDLLQKLASAKDWGATEVARTVEVKDAQGRPATQQFDKFGRPVGEALQQWKAPERVDTGGAFNFVDPVTLATLGTLGKTMTPGEQASNQLGWANHSISRQRLAIDAAQADKPQWDAERGLLINTRTGQAMPAMQGGQPVGPKQKELTDAQAKALLFGSRAREADKLIEQLRQAGVSQPGLLKRMAQSVPEWMGGGDAGAMGTIWNATQSADQQSVEQAQRDFINAVLRRESGAVISPQEFANARQQYFPQPGDEPQVIEQKARNRALATQGMLAEVPAARRDVLGGQTPQPMQPAQRPALRWNPQTGGFD